VLSGGLNLVYGYTGLLSFAQVGFFGIGGYTAALLVTERGWSLWAGAAAGGALAALVGLVVGYSSLRLSRHAFAIVSLSFALLCLIVARDWVSLTRGAMGIPGLPIPSMDLPGGLRWRLAQPADFYYLLMGFAVVAQAAIYLVVSSRLGRAMRAIKLNEPLAQSQGINPLSYKLLAIALSALLAGIAGGFFVFYLTIVDPSIFDFYYTETMLIMVIIGGPGSFWGVLASSAVLAALPDLLRFTTDLRMVLYGAVLIAAMLLFPGGVAGWRERRRLQRWRRPRVRPS
jgi:branched-chain amino acid transport system permease protein